MILDKSPTGIDGFDEITKDGVPEGRTTLIAGNAGCVKTSIAGAFACSVCRTGERAVYFAFEESASQIQRNLRSIGIDLAPWIDGELLTIVAERPSLSGLETMLHMMARAIDRAEPAAVVIDPVSGMNLIGSNLEIKHMLTRFIDMLKEREVTILMTSLKSGNETWLEREVGISSLVDSRLELRAEEFEGESYSGLHIVKARGMNHSHRYHRLIISSEGLSIGKAPDLVGERECAEYAHE